MRICENTTKLPSTCITWALDLETILWNTKSEITRLAELVYTKFVDDVLGSKATECVGGN